jgi:hypothetical protein
MHRAIFARSHGGATNGLALCPRRILHRFTRGDPRGVRLFGDAPMPAKREGLRRIAATFKLIEVVARNAV